MADRDESETKSSLTLRLTAQIISAYVGNHAVSASEVPTLIGTVHAKLLGLSGGAATTEEPMNQKPAVPIKKSVTPDYVICLEDGKKLKMLKRYLRSRYGLSPEEYRAKWSLPPDYPMVAPNYAQRRSDFAKKIGLGKTTSAGKGKGKKHLRAVA